MLFHSRFWGAPIFSQGFGTSRQKIGTPQKSEIQPGRIQPSILSLLYEVQVLLSLRRLRNPSTPYRGQHPQDREKRVSELFGPDFPQTFLTLTPGRPWVKKFLPITGAAEKCTFWCGHPRCSARTSMTRRVVEKLCTRKVCVDFLAHN